MTSNNTGITLTWEEIEASLTNAAEWYNTLSRKACDASLEVYEAKTDAEISRRRDYADYVQENADKQKSYLCGMARLFQKAADCDVTFDYSELGFHHFTRLRVFRSIRAQDISDRDLKWEAL